MSLKIRETLQRFDAFYHGSDTQNRERLQQALDVIDRSIDIFSLEGVCFSFNGGKDSTVILYLLLIVIAKKLLEEKKIAVDKTKNEGTTVTSPRNNFVEPALIPEKELEAKVLEHVKRIPVMYFDSHDQFPEVRQFIETCVQRYALTCHVYKCSFVEGVNDMLSKLKIKAIYMGVRGGDPHTDGMEHFSPSSPGWPPFLRINPILKWKYEDVWQFLRECQLEYCNLYDHGYTSLGNIYDTVQNPALWRKGVNGTDGYYLPAYQLHDGTMERSGRQKKARTSSK